MDQLTAILTRIGKIDPVLAESIACGYASIFEADVGDKVRFDMADPEMYAEAVDYFNKFAAIKKGGRFAFSGNDARALLEKLSGCENTRAATNRLYLALANRALSKDDVVKAIETYFSTASIPGTVKPEHTYEQLMSIDPESTAYGERELWAAVRATLFPARETELVKYVMANEGKFDPDAYAEFIEAVTDQVGQGPGQHQGIRRLYKEGHASGNFIDIFSNLDPGSSGKASVEGVRTGFRRWFAPAFKNAGAQDARIRQSAVNRILHNVKQTSYDKGIAAEAAMVAPLDYTYFMKHLVEDFDGYSGLGHDVFSGNLGRGK